MSTEWKNLPDTSTPITAENLIKDQTAVQNTQPTGGQGVWIKDSKNLFDKNNAKTLNASFNAGQVNTLTSNENTITVYIPCKPSTTYTFSKTLGARFFVGYTKTTPALNVEVFGRAGANNSTEWTITTDSDAKYLVAFVYSGIIDTSLTSTQVLNTLQIEYGSTAHTYESYIENPTINTNINGQYKEIYNKDNMGDLVVDDIQGKNLFDNLFRQGSWFDTTNATRIYSSQKLYLKAGTYTVSTNLNFTTFDYAIDLATFTSPAGAGHSPDIYDSGWVSTLSHTFTFSRSGYFYIGVRKKDNSNITPSDISGTYFQLEQGSEATSYTPYKSFDSTAYVLWTNPDDTQSFANQLVALNDALANYKYYEIIYKRNATMSRYLSTGRIPTNKASDMITNLNYNYIRTISEIWTNSFRISDCVYYATYGSTTSTQSNTFLIPYQILGYK